MFTVEERDWARDRILDLARAGKRLVAGAFVGSLADETGQSDRWSDIDLTFALDDDVLMEEVLADWTSTVQKELKAIHLFDLPHQSTVYRVFLLPHALQMDLSFTPRKDFRPYGPKFRLIYGQAGEPKYPETALPRHMFGLAVHHLVRARICLERHKLWQCAYWINETRNQILALACLDKGLPSSHGRGFDSLPLEVLKPLERTQIGSVEPSALIEAIRGLVDGLLRNSGSAKDLAASLEPQLALLQELSRGYNG